MLGYFGIGHVELLIVAFVILLLFGNRLPGLMRSLGRGVVEFKSGLRGDDDDDDDDAIESPKSKSKKTEKIEED
ncbi:MAG: twin-arginine translocase TatA/TatE family subunit [Planctomycetaceae bacterium]|nr:twin-arginine translocase TatA/TatE family subunit [Planctomycetaceae bacterium]